MAIVHSCVTMRENNTKEWGDTFTKRSWESSYSGLIIVGLVFSVFTFLWNTPSSDWRNTGLEVAVLIIGTAMISVVAEKVDKKEIEKMKRPEEEKLKDIV